MILNQAGPDHDLGNVRGRGRVRDRLAVTLTTGQTAVERMADRSRAVAFAIGGLSADGETIVFIVC